MAKTEKELEELKEKVEELSRELNELSDEELTQVAGGKVMVKSDFNNDLYPG